MSGKLTTSSLGQEIWNQMADQGVSADTVITLYNAQSSQTTALKGARKLALTSLLRPECRMALQCLVELVGRVGPSQVFREEPSWANKRIMPGHRNQYRSTSKVWQEVLRVTPQSFLLCVRSLSHQQIKRILALRKRLAPCQLEAHVALCAMVCW